MKTAAPLLALALTACAAAPVPTGDPGRYRSHDVQLSAGGPAGCPETDAATVGAAVASTSSLRAASGLGPVRADPRLVLIAARQACHMAASGRMSHAGPRGEGPMRRAKDAGYAPALIAENIAAGPFDLSGVLSVWAGSREHRANATMRGVVHMGIGSATDASGNRYWAAVYGAPR